MIQWKKFSASVLWGAGVPNQSVSGTATSRTASDSLNRLNLVTPCPRFTMILIIFWIAATAPFQAARSADWPTYQANPQRTNATSEKLMPPLVEKWRFQPKHAPSPAWPHPARNDLGHNRRGLRNRMLFDHAFHVVVAGQGVYYSSSASDTVVCLDVESGRVQWTYFTEGPVRFAPTVADGSLYVGSDDGWVYCLNARDGKLQWKRHPGSDERRLPGNGRMISRWPVRSGILVEDGVAYACAGLFPSKGVFLCAFEAKTGKVRYKRRTPYPAAIRAKEYHISRKRPRVSAQGYLVSDGTRLAVPTGRTGPVFFNREDGKYIHSRVYAQGAGGDTLAVNGHFLFQGTGIRKGKAYFFANRLSTALRASRMAVADGLAYLSTGTELAALRLNPVLVRSKKRIKPEYLWKQPYACPYSLILAGDILFAGGEEKVVGVRATDGEKCWTAKVNGKAHSLAVAQNSLFVSTDKGTIHCFGEHAATGAPLLQKEDSNAAQTNTSNASKYSAAARTILERAASSKGYCLVLDSGEGRLAYEIAKRSAFKVIAVVKDAKQAEKARRTLHAAGLHGQVSVHLHAGERLPYPSYFADLVVSDRTVTLGTLPASPSEVIRVLRPSGGLAIFGHPKKSEARFKPGQLEAWMKRVHSDSQVVVKDGTWGIFRRGPLPGAGEWTHQFANAANTSCSGDTHLKGEMDVLWFGAPGPRPMIDRHHKAMSPLVKDGRLFVSANESVIAVNAYNGTILWNLDVPGSRRVAMYLDSGHIVLARNALYIAVKDTCWAVAADTGKRKNTIAMPQVTKGRISNWGHLACVGDRLIGTGVAPNAANSLEFEGRKKKFYAVLSDYIFSVNRHDGETKWHYGKGAILNTSITIGSKHIYFVESRTLSSSTGRTDLAAFCATETFLVALASDTGHKLWETRLQLPYQHVLYLCCSQDTVLVSGSHGTKTLSYSLFAHDLKTGKQQWKWDMSIPEEYHHGMHLQHPVMVGNKIYTRFFALELSTGKPLSEWNIERQWRGCGTISASKDSLFYRNAHPQMFSVNDQKSVPLNLVSRTGCLINIIPAGGIILVPEASSGCTCSYPMQTSFAYIAK